MRADESLKDTPVLVMTAFSEIEPGHAVEAGADRFLTKPFDLAELTQAVRDLL